MYWMLLSPGVLCYGRLFHLSPSGGSSVVLYAGLEGSLRLSYTLPQLQGIWYTTPDFFSSGSQSLTFVSCPQNADRKTVWMLYLLYTRLTSSLRPAT